MAKTKYILYRFDEDDRDYYLHGVYDTPAHLANAALELGRMGFTQIKVEEIEK